MKIVLVGGGTGGHITPLLAVARELKVLHPGCHLMYVGEVGSKFAHLLDQELSLEEKYWVHAGKFRRYHGQSWITRLLDVQTNILNMRDILRVFIGFWQSFHLLSKLKPDVVFIKGGFVGLPVGLAAAWLKIPYVTHDSDSLPGLTNRLIARWARVHAVGMPEEFYSYPPNKTQFVGIPLSPNYVPVTPALKAHYRESLNLPNEADLVFVTGGSQGAQRLNIGFSHIAKELLLLNERVVIVHQTGKTTDNLYQDLPQSLSNRVHCYEFIPDMFLSSGAADVVVTRAGATTLAELAVQGIACIIVPHTQLTGGHQVKNAKIIAEAGAAIVVDEEKLQEHPEILFNSIKELLISPEKRQALETALGALRQVDAARKIAMLLSDIAYKN